MTAVSAPGFVAAGVACGVKRSGDLDLSLVATADAVAVTAAAVFTTNRVAAAPVQVSRAHLAATGGRVAAVVLNSGNANAATGAPGRAQAESTCEAVARELGCARAEVLVCSTGLIGIPLPVEAVLGGVPALVAARSASPQSGLAAARAIMTTDTRPRLVEVRGDRFTVGGMAKGAAMLAPSMATMLAVLTTDAAIDRPALQAALTAAVQGSFNELSVDGCTSTNDTVIVLASGRAGTPPGGDAAVAAALAEACSSLAAQMADDAEGATKVARVTVVGAASTSDAARAARRVAESELVKCSLYGADPYWGRVLSEVGSSGAEIDPEGVTVSYGGVVVCRHGVAADPQDGDSAAAGAAALAAHMAGRHIEITVDLGLGAGEASVLTTDLTHAYIDENMGTS